MSASPRPLRIGILAPPWYTVPPAGYGGTELVVYLLARELHANGHSVTVFGAGGESHTFTTVRLAGPDWGEDIGTPRERFRMATYLRRLYRLIRPAEFDVIHDHLEATGPVLASLLQLKCPIVATVHSALREAHIELYRDLSREVDLVAISESQRSHAPEVRWAGVVHNAVEESALTVGLEKDDYILELGRITPDKGQHVAIDVARRLGVRLVLAGKVDPAPAAQTYFRELIEPELGPGVSWIPNVSGSEKAELLARARAMLFPIDWEEPFGIAIVEAMASGTPVIAFRRGAAPELVETGRTGFVVDTSDEMVAAFERVAEIDPADCARRARERFNPRRLATDYERIYREAVARCEAEPVPATANAAS